MQINTDEYTRQIIKASTENEGNDRFLLVHELIVELVNKGRRIGRKETVTQIDSLLNSVRV